MLNIGDEAYNDCTNINYYFNKKGDTYKGVIITGRAVSTAADIKHSSGVRLTSENVDTEGKGIANAAISVLSLDGDAELLEDGQTCYTTATTDKDGNFEVFLPAELMAARIIDKASFLTELRLSYCCSVWEFQHHCGTQSY